MIISIARGTDNVIPIVRIRDEYQFHNNLAFQYIHDSSHHLWNPSKAFYHFEQAIKGNHERKSLYLYNYARFLYKLDIHPCSNYNCTNAAKKRCDKCKNVHYCSKDCQTQHWHSFHKSECQKKKLEKDQKYVKIRVLLEEAIALELQNGFTSPPNGTPLDNKKSQHFDWNSSSKNKFISKQSVYSRSILLLSKLLCEKFDEHQKAVELVNNVLKYERDEEMMNSLLKMIQYTILKNESLMLQTVEQLSKCDVNVFHNVVAFFYIVSEEHPLWNPSKAFYHFEQSIKGGNHFWKSLCLSNYAYSLLGLMQMCDIHQCDNDNCTNVGDKQCIKCKNTYYCSRECQVKHWRKKHKSECDGNKSKQGKEYVKPRELLEQAIAIEKDQGFINIPVRYPVINSWFMVMAEKENVMKSRNVSINSIYSQSIYLLCGVLKTRFDELHNAIDLIKDALEYEQHKETKFDLQRMLHMALLSKRARNKRVQ